MAVVHITPTNDIKDHKVDHGVDCWCEPRLELNSTDNKGRPAKVWVHQCILTGTT